MKKYIKPSTATWMVEPDFVLNPESEVKIQDKVGPEGLTKGIDGWEEEEADGFGW